MDNNRYILLQINDSLFPIGGYSHSYGLETYIQEGIIKNAAGAADYIYNYLFYNQCYNDFLIIKLVYDYAFQPDIIKQIDALDELMTAAKAPFEIRGASYRLGSRFVKAVSCMDIAFSKIYYDYYAGKNRKHYPLLYSLFCLSLEIAYEDAISSFLYSQTSLIVTNCVKSVPLSQYDGQKILYGCHAHFGKLINRLSALTVNDYGLSAPGFDVRCMQHERLYSRIYMS